VSSHADLAMPRAEAWGRLRNLTLASRYVPGVTGIEITTPQTEGVGASRKVYSKGKPLLDETVVDWQDGQGFTVRLHKGDEPPAPFRQAQFTYRLEDTPDGQCRMVTTMAYEVPPGLAWRMLDGLVMRHVVMSTVRKIARRLQGVYNAPA